MSELEPELDKLFAWAETEKASHLELVERLLGEAAGKKRERSIERRIKDSGLRVRKTLEAFDFNFQPKLDTSLIESLMTLRFVEKKEDVLFTGKSGHIARKRASELGVELETAVTPNISTLREDSGPLETKQPTP